MRGNIYATLFQANTKTMPFTRQLLTSWDVSVSDRSTAEQMPTAIVENFRAIKYEADWRTVAKERDEEVLKELRVRRLIVMSIHAGLQVIMWVAVAFATAYVRRSHRCQLPACHTSSKPARLLPTRTHASPSYSTRVLFVAPQSSSITAELGGGTIGSLIPAVIIVGINMVMPTMCWILANGAKWDNPESTRRHKIIGFFFGRMMTLVIISISFYNLFQLLSPSGNVIGQGFLTESSDGITGWDKTLADGSGDFRCPQDKFVNFMLLQIVVEFIVPKLTCGLSN
jgi:hypothetical protein